MAVRGGMGLDGVVADFRSAFEEAAAQAGVRFAPESPSESTADPFSSTEIKRIWDYVRRTPNWWVRLNPYEPAQIARLYALVRRLKWEIVFLTRRPASA